MCDNYRNTDTANWFQYHPVLRAEWNSQITVYRPKIIRTPPSPYMSPPLFDEFSQRGTVIAEGYSNWGQAQRTTPK